MGKIKGFMEFERINETVVKPKDRIKNYKTFPLLSGRNLPSR